MELAAFLPLLFVRMSLFALWNASPSRQTQREDYNSENVIDLLEALNVTRGGVRGVSKVKGQEAGLVAWRFRSRTPHLTLPREHTLYLLSSAHGSLGLHLIGQQARQSTATLLSLMSRGQLLLRLVSCTRSNTLRLEYPRHTHAHSDAHTHTHTHTHTLELPGGSPFMGGAWVQLALGVEPRRVALFTDCTEEVVLELTQPDDVINLRLPLDLQVTFASEMEEPTSKFSGSWQTAEISTHAYQKRPWPCPTLTEPMPLPIPRSEVDEAEDPAPPIMHLEERVGVANDQPQRVVLGAPGRRAQPPTLTPANAETHTHTHTHTHASHGERISRLEERLDGVNTMLQMLKNQNTELAKRVRYLESCECVRRVCVWEGVEMESGKSWETDSHSLCTCTNGEVHCTPKHDPCSSAPCLNGGVCEVVTSDLGFVCSCPPSTEGRLCEKPHSSVSSQACFLPVLKGRCQERAEPAQRWFYNPASSSCEHFLFSGCHGNSNNFLTRQACEEQCVLGACCYRLTDPDPSRHGDQNSFSATPEPTAGSPEWAGPGPNASLEAWQGCGSGPIACERVPARRCQLKGAAAVSFSPGRSCPAAGCVWAARRDCACVFNGRTLRPGQALEVGCEVCVCSYRGVLECTCRSPQPRKEIRDLSQSEMREYQLAVQALYLQPECQYEGNIYRADEEFKPDCCSTCVCKNGQMNCVRVSCSSLSCQDQYTPDGECCPVCRSGCEYEGVWYENGDVFVSQADPCLNCSCTNSQVKCVSKQCPRPRCSNPFQLPGECCPTCTACDLEGRPPNNTIISTLDGCQTCTCQNGAVSCDAVQRCTQRCVEERLCCRHQPGLVLLDGFAFPDPRDTCKRCTCTEGSVVCTGMACPTLDCSLVETVGGVCCPRCRSCVLDGVWHEHGSQWNVPDDPCGACTCVEGQVRCESRKCNPPCTYPSSPRPGTCCPVCNGCGVNGLDFLNGDRVPSGDRCEECVCVNGDLHCKPLPCPPTPCPRPIKRPEECCPRCEQCEYESQVFADGQAFPSRADPCLSCRCSAGEVVCDRLDSQCPDVRCTHPAKPHGHCCASCEMCEYERRLYADGKVFNPPGSGPCVQCTCKRGSVRCHKQRCPSVPCANPIRDPQLCCPVCKVCILNGVELEEGSQWEVECNRCVCVDGEVVCRSAHCPPATCQHPSKTNGDCCGSCERCSYNNRIYDNGQTFTDPDDPCQRCLCQDGTVVCTVIDCPHLTCSNPYKPPGQCCPQCPDCDFENRVFVNGEQFPNPLSPCEECVCVSGAVECQPRHCSSPTCQHPLPASCCRNNCNGCSYAGKEYPNGAEFPHPTDKCRTCHCINGNVQCLMKRCPALQCTVPVSVRGECCPQCPAPPANCVYLGQTYTHTQRFYHPTDSCQSCSCSNGTVSCVRKPCPPALCVHPIGQDCCRTCDGCLYDGTEHPNGGVFADVSDPCGVCVCREGTVTCERKRCPLVTCPFPIDRECCHSCDGCLYVGVEYQSGQEFVDPASECGVCVCVSGRVTCTPKPCYTPGCTHPVTLPGHCCPVCDGCFYGNSVMLNGQVFPDTRDSCSECTCRAGSVQCLRRVCSTAPCPHPVSDPCDCPVCEGCVFQGGVYADGQSFSSPKADCDVCTCSKGRVVCAPRVCAKVSCAHPALDGCLCGVCDGCLFHQRNYGNGEHFPHPQDRCQRCTCLNGGVTCVSLSCPPVVCGRPVTPPGECCPVCTGVCEHLGRVYDSGSSFPDPNDRCSTCTCLNEVVLCQRKPCVQQCTHPAVRRDCCPVCEACVYEGQEYTHTQSFTPRALPCERCVCVSGSVTCSPLACPVLSCSNTHTPPGQCCPECRVCSQDGVEYSEGQTWSSKSDPCQKCTCAFGEVVCVGPQCPALTCTNQLTDPDSCCPRCKGCVYRGVEHSEGSVWFDSLSPCTSCMCVGGVTTCSELRCISPCTHTVSVPGECCPVCADCIYDDKVYGPGDAFHPAGDPCQICVCEVMPDGEQHLRCVRKQCPSLVNCPKENILFSSDSCCPVCAQPLSNCTATLIGNEVLATDDPCFTCQCKDLTWTCIHQTCVPLSCPPQEQHTPPDSCCAVCDECVIEGERKRVPNGHRWTDSTNECISCTCNLGYIECEIEECGPVVCDDGWVKVKPPGKCCYECQDSGASCEYQAQVYVSNEHWQVDECTSCTCVSGDVHCQTERCPPTNCAADETPALIPGMCCPHCLPRPATCIAFGDPHYRTFDGRMVNFQGACTYVLTEDCHGGDFSIHVTNDARGRKGVSWTKDVTLFIADITIRLLQNWVVMVDSKQVSLPYLKEPYVYVERRTNTILLNTNIGLKVHWNGRSHLEVSVPGTYKKHTCGLCGNFNNYPQDDLRLRNGQLTSSEAAFGNAWRVASRNSSSCVLEAQDINPCKSAGYSARKSANARCAVLKGSMFERCHKVVPPEMFYAACVYDLCACGANSEECVCDALEAYASECREAGVILQWRSSSLCAVGCPVDRGFVFDECGPPCPVTCVTRDVPLGEIEAQCFKPCVPGCQCPAGRVLHDNHCIRPDTCPNIIHNST